MKDYDKLLELAKEKASKSFLLLKASLDDILPYDKDKIYSPKELEPYDALTDRFIRCVEMFLGYFETYEYSKYVITSDTLRDRLNNMEKLEIITNTIIWLNMRDVRNRIVHDYLPGQIKDMYDSIMNEFYKELKYTRNRI